MLLKLFPLITLDRTLTKLNKPYKNYIIESKSAILYIILILSSNQNKNIWTKKDIQ